MKAATKARAYFLFLILMALFIAALVTCNLIANKYVEVDLGFKVFVLSAGVLPYPITFLLTDIMSEIYGRRQTNKVVIVGFIASLFVILIVHLGSIFPAVPDSNVSDEVYNTTFKSAWRIILASMTAYLTAQLIDVRLFHFWKNLTNGRMLWLRNNASTIFSQLIDSALVTTVIFIGDLEAGKIISFILDAWLFKILVALADTPFMYGATYLLRRNLGLKMGEEVKEINN